MGKTDTEHDRYLVPGLVRGLAVLQAFSAARPRMGLSELAAALGTTRSAMFRIAYTLTELGFLLQDGRTRAYSLGPAVLKLGYGHLAARDVLELALPVLERLRDATGWSAHLAVREGREVVYLLRVPTRRGLASIVHVGSRLPAHATSMGRVLLAGLEPGELAALYRDDPPQRASLATLQRRARADAAAGHVLHRGEFEQGLASIAAPLRDASGRVVAAINLSAPEPPGFDAKPLVARLAAAAAEISRAAGWTG